MRSTRAILTGLGVLICTAGYGVPADAQSTTQFGQTDFSPWFTIWLPMAILAILFYITPSMVAFGRQHPNRWAIAVVNLVFGGTGLGWLGSLVWACSAVHISPTGNNGGESGLNLFVNDAVITKVDPLPAAMPADATAARLDQLKRLHEQGALSAEEHASMRKSVLYMRLGWVGAASVAPPATFLSTTRATLTGWTIPICSRWGSDTPLARANAP